jgi:hypothetical protein
MRMKTILSKLHWEIIAVKYGAFDHPASESGTKMNIRSAKPASSWQLSKENRVTDKKWVLRFE